MEARSVTASVYESGELRARIRVRLLSEEIAELVAPDEAPLRPGVRYRVKVGPSEYVAALSIRHRPRRMILSRVDRAGAGVSAVRAELSLPR